MGVTIPCFIQNDFALAKTRSITPYMPRKYCYFGGLKQ